MKKTRINQIIGVFMMAMVLVMSGTSVQAQLDQDSKTWKMIEELNNQLEEGLNTGNFYNVSALYADNARIILPDGESITGRKAISEYFDINRIGKTMDLQVLEVGGSGKTLYQVGKAISRSESGEESVNEFLIVWERQPDWAYKIYIDTL